MLTSPSRPFGFNPSRLRAYGAARCACLRESPAGYPSRAMLGAPRCSRTGMCWIGPASAPPQWAGLVGLRPSLLPQVARKHAVLDAGGSSPGRHEGRFTDTPPSPAMEFPRHASCKRPPATSGALSPCRWVLSWLVSGRRPVKPSRGDAESAMSPFGSGPPVRPCVVVNPGGGTAAPWASWPQPCSETISPALRAFLAGQILFASRFSTVLRPLRGAASPSPAGRITTRTHWRDLVQPERRNHHG